MNWPQKLSELLEMALRDFEVCENSPEVTIDMTVWYQDCKVCLAGAVIYRNNLKIEKFAGQNIPDEGAKYLRAINYLRQGFVSIAQYCLNGTFVQGVLQEYPPSTVRAREIVSYHMNREKWWKQIRELLKDLKEANE